MPKPSPPEPPAVFNRLRVAYNPAYRDVTEDAMWMVHNHDLKVYQVARALKTPVEGDNIRLLHGIINTLIRERELEIPLLPTSRIKLFGDQQ